MTCIVGLIENGKGYLAADSLGSNGHTQDVYKNPKLFRKGGFLFGYTSSFRMGQLLQHRLQLPEPKKGQSTDDYIHVDFVDAVRALLKAHGYAKIDSNRESVGTFLFVYDGRLFAMQDDLAILESSQGFDACGSGEHYARAVIHALRNSKLTPEIRLTRAIETAAEFVSSVGGAITVLPAD